jgi:hypothetical protein
MATANSLGQPSGSAVQSTSMVRVRSRHASTHRPVLPVFKAEPLSAAVRRDGPT